MKTRQGFVSNSSSSSFIVKKDKITVAQLDMIKSHIDVAKKINEAVKDTGGSQGMRRKGGYRDMADGSEEWDDNIILGTYYADTEDAWSIEETPFEIRGNTWMNNFDMEVFLKEIGIPEKDIKMRGD